MLVALTGTPGTGKTSIAEILRENNFKVIDLNKFAIDSGFVVDIDKKRDSNIVDIEKLDQHVKNNFLDESLVIFEGHLSHLLKSLDKVIILRCHPKKLFENLSNRNWNKQKIRENIEAEILDIILCESLEIHKKSNLFELDLSEKSIEEASLEIINILQDGFKEKKKYKIGKIDWSEEILKDF